MFIKKLRQAAKTRMNSHGSALIMAVLFCSIAVIIIGFSLSAINVSEDVREKVGNEEYAYLAAKSGISVFEKMADTDTGAEKILNARGKDALKMDFGDLGSADIKVYLTKKWVQDKYNDGSPKYEADGVTPIMVEATDDEKVKVECVGTYDNSAFKLVRYIKVKEITKKKFPFEKKAYTQYGNKDIIINGHIDGPVLIYGDARVNVTNALNAKPTGVDHEMHELVASGNVDMRPIGGGMSSSSVIFKYIVTGGHLIIAAGETVKGDVLVGSKNDDGTVKSGVYFYGNVPIIGGALKCEGDVILGNSAAIGTTNWNGASCLNSSEIVLWSNGKTYIGYECTPGSTGYSGLTQENSTKTIYGGVVSKGDLKIYGHAVIYGDIYCNGSVEIGGNAEIHGNIYAAGSVSDTSNSDTFPNDSSEIWSGGTITLNSATVTQKTVADGSITQDQLDAILMQYFDGRDIIGADKYLTEEKIKSPKPKITFPAKFGSMLPTSFNLSKCTGCIDPAYAVHMPHNGIEWCDGYRNDLGANCTDPTYRNADGTHIRHQYENPHWTCTNQWCGNLLYYTHTEHDIPSTGTIHIASDCIIEEDISVSDRDIYLDASHNDIDILLKGSISTTNSAKIFVNDGAGSHRVRIFMDTNAKINLGNSWDYTYSVGIVPISDAYPDLAVDQLPSTTVDTKIAPGKVPQLYIFSRDAGNPEINMTGSAVYLPAYAIAPDLTINITDGSGRGTGHSNGDVVKYENGGYPYLYGLFTVKVCNFDDMPSTHIKYDETLESLADGSDSVNGEKFSNAIADVVSY